MTNTTKILAAFALIAALSSAAWADVSEKPAAGATKGAQEAVRAALDLTERQGIEDADRGFIAPLPDNGRVQGADGAVVWDPSPYAFLNAADAADAPGPDTVHPALWRQSQLVLRGGLYKVTEGIYQVRNADISNLTVVEGRTGVIVIDPLISAETARMAMDLYFAHRPKKPVKAVIFSHSHVDHYGGVLGVITREDVKEGRTRVIAPEGFLEAAVTENILAGQAMGRRAQFMYGQLLPPGPRGHVGAGLGLACSTGSTALLPPTELVTRDTSTLEIDGLTFEFQLAPGTEAPAEMHWFIPEMRALSAAENCVRTMHNLYTLRGARARDPLLWAEALDASLRRWGDRAEVLYGMHHWPVWGGERVRRALSLGRDLYRHINDQTLRLANRGLNMEEIAERIVLPPELDRPFELRGYYGSLRHNVRGVYAFYLGWFDGNAARLNPLPPSKAAARYVEYMGGEEAVLKRAREDFARGEFRWTAQVLNHVVFANPANKEARELEADALEQLGYQAESGPWRNFYLSAAQELRGLAPKPAGAARNQDISLLAPQEFFRALAVRLDGQRAAGQKIVFAIRFTDAGEVWRIDVSNGVLHADRTDAPREGETVLSGRKGRIFALFAGGAAALPEQGGDVAVDGDRQPIRTLQALLDPSGPAFFPLTLPAADAR